MLIKKDVPSVDFSTSFKIKGKHFSYRFVVVKDTVNFTQDRVRKGTDYLLAMQGLTVRTRSSSHSRTLKK